MADPLLNAISILMCSHGGRCVPVALSPRVKVSGAPCLLAGTPMPIAGCTAPPNLGAPCTMAQALTGSLRIRSMGQPVLTLTSTLLALPTGLLVRIANPGQTRVTGV
jgi:hypothetical protein